MDLKQVIKMSASFGALSNADIDALVGAMAVGQFADGHAFTVQGEPSLNLYLVLDGAVEVCQRDIVTGAWRERAVLREGELFGIYALLDAMPAAASRSASGAVRAAWLDQDSWRLLDQHHPAIGFLFQFMLASQLARDLQALNQSVAALAAER